MSKTKIRIDQFADSTRVISGTGVSINGGDNTKFDIQVVGEIFNPSTKVLTPISINLTAQTVTNLAQKVTYVGVDVNGTVIQQAGRFTTAQKYSHLTEFVLVHTNGSNLNAVNNYPNMSGGIAIQFHNYMRTIGNLNGSGNVYSANGANVKINKSSGVLVGPGFGNGTADNPNEVATASASALTFRIRNQNGTETADITDLDTSAYDLNGTTTTLPGGATSNNWQTYRIYLFTSNLTRFQRGQHIYTSMAEAEANIQSEIYVVEQNNADNGTLRGYLIVRKGCSDLTDTARAKFIEANKFGNAPAGGTIVPTMQAAYDVSTQPQILVDDTRLAIQIKNGRALDTSTVLEVKNIAGTVTHSVDGNGKKNVRVTSITSSSTPTPNADTDDEFIITALAAAPTFGIPSGIPTQGQVIIIRIKDNGTARALLFNSIYRFSGDQPAPTTTILSKTMYIMCIFNFEDTKWDSMWRDNY